VKVAREERGAIIRTLFAPTAETKRGTASAPPSVKRRIAVSIDPRDTQERKIAMQSRARGRTSRGRFFFFLFPTLLFPFYPIYARARARALFCVTERRMLEIWHATRESRARVSAAL